MTAPDHATVETLRARVRELELELEQYRERRCDRCECSEPVAVMVWDPNQVECKRLGMLVHDNWHCADFRRRDK